MGHAAPGRVPHRRTGLLDSVVPFRKTQFDKTYWYWCK